MKTEDLKVILERTESNITALLKLRNEKAEEIGQLNESIRKKQQYTEKIRQELKNVNQD